MMKNDNVREVKNHVVLFGSLCIIIGILINKFTIAALFTTDGEITSRFILFFIILVQIVFIGTGLYLVIKKPHFSLTIPDRITSPLGIIGIGFSVLLSPPLFRLLFAMSDLLPGEKIWLWIFTLALFLFSIFLIYHKGSIGKGIIALFMSGLLLIFLELAIRLVIVVIFSGSKPVIAKLANDTYPEFSVYKPHFLLHYLHNPDYTLINSGSAKRVIKIDYGSGETKPFNSHGFIGPEISSEKPETTVRIICMGGSTTAKGYPKLMEDFLKKVNPDTIVDYEVLNFGVSSFTTAHSAVNFILNVIDLNPDYVVLHHAWNDYLVRNAADFKNDYSHALKPFQIPPIYDKYPIRVSVIYRMMKNMISSKPSWAYLLPAIMKRDYSELKASAKKMQWSNLDELKPYRRNLEAIIDLAIARNIKIVLVTMPHSTDPEVKEAYIAPHIDQCNDIMREINEKYSGKIVFFDMDKLMTGKMDSVFNDLGHVNEFGINFKAERIGQVILNDRASINK